MLLLVFLFNVGGYYILFWSLRRQTDKELTLRLDTNRYDPGKTIKLRIPVTLPYPLETTGYKRVDGRFEHNGEFFKLVKQKLQGDTLYVICIRDDATRALVETMTDYMQLTQALPFSDTGQRALHLLSKLIKEFCTQRAIDIGQPTAANIILNYPNLSDDLRQPVIPVLAPPPKHPAILS